MVLCSAESYVNSRFSDEFYVEEYLKPRYPTERGIGLDMVRTDGT